jgi:hypothetical protein
MQRGIAGCGPLPRALVKRPRLRAWATCTALDYTGGGGLAMLCVACDLGRATSPAFRTTSVRSYSSAVHLRTTSVRSYSSAVHLRTASVGCPVD